MNDLFEVVYEDSDILVINKPAGLVCHPTKGDEYSSLISRVRLYLNARGHLVNRLDRETGGIVLAAKNPVAAGELGKLWENRSVQKFYLAIVHGTMEKQRSVIEFPLGKDEVSQIAVKDCVRTDGVTARTEYIAHAHFQRGGRDFSLVRVWPLTGRKHQIRIHLAAAGHPIVGDKLYGGDEDLYLALAQDRLTDEQRARLILPNQALHCVELKLTWRRNDMIFRAPPDAAFSEFAGLPAEKATAIVTASSYEN